MTTDGKVPETQQCDLTMSNKETRSAAVAPSADQYAAALRRLSLSQTQIAMLTFHFNADERTVTAKQMAQAVGFTH
ncbi:hypothetical protein [Candidatus Thiosymbion oneisti]|uniref:hypothetical protein n=1 Tax=Candidatus Thiosymbion oneisti TaxID=589554 RepID=UPI00105FF15B|nr:hypothetical protein [Candidatus Thiosymbion oneisti]